MFSCQVRTHPFIFHDWLVGALNAKVKKSLFWGPVSDLSVVGDILLSFFSNAVWFSWFSFQRMQCPFGWRVATWAQTCLQPKLRQPQQQKDKAKESYLLSARLRKWARYLIVQTQSSWQTLSPASRKSSHWFHDSLEKVQLWFAHGRMKSTPEFSDSSWKGQKKPFSSMFLIFAKLSLSVLPNCLFPCAHLYFLNQRPSTKRPRSELFQMALCKKFMDDCNEYPSCPSYHIIPTLSQKLIDRN